MACWLVLDIRHDSSERLFAKRQHTIFALPTERASLRSTRSFTACVAAPFIRFTNEAGDTFGGADTTTCT